MASLSIKNQFRNNLVAIISLMIATTALSYTAWREETTEKNRTTRTAGFEVLLHLGELQLVVNQDFYMPHGQPANPYIGWGHVAFVSDLSGLLPQPIPKTIENLVTVWGENWETLKTNKEAVDKVSDAIDKAREETLQAIHSLR